MFSRDQGVRFRMVPFVCPSKWSLRVCVRCSLSCAECWHPDIDRQVSGQRLVAGEMDERDGVDKR